MSTPRAKVAIVAAMQREVWPLVKHWPVSRRQSGGREFAFFEQEHVVVVCGGIGGGHARRATEAVIELYRPRLVISAGFAGALRADIPVGRVVSPRLVIDAGDGSRSFHEAGAGVLVSVDAVADAQQKAKLAASYGAEVVDMEAASVSRGAQAHGLPFMACKAVSDASACSLPPTTPFVGSDGGFQTARFAVYAAFRPWLWGGVLRLARDSSLAARNLCERLAAISEETAQEIPAGEKRTSESEAVLTASAPVKS